MVEKYELGQIIARRIIKTPEGKTLEVRMFAPLPLDPDDKEKDDSYCALQIVGVSEDITWRSGGVDPFQAIELGLRSIGSQLDLLNRTEYSGKLEWLEPGGPLGFPMIDDEKSLYG